VANKKDDPGREVDARGAKGVQIGSDNLQVNVYAPVRPKARSAYHHQVRAIAPDILVGRETELADLAAFCTTPGPESYLWLRGDPWAGKTALTSWFALNPPPGVRVVSFFITARLAAQSDREAFLDVVIEQLASILGEPIPAYLTDATRAARLWEMLERAAVFCADQGERLILTVDGLDEDTGADSHSIAALLPAKPVAGMRVIVAGRHDPPTPSDVPNGHPLRDHAIVCTLAASPHAQDIRREAERELKRLLRGTPIEQDLLGLVTAAGGGLSSRDLEELTGHQTWEIEESLHAVAGRTFTRRPVPGSAEPSPQAKVYMLGHEELQSAAVRFLSEARLSECRQLLHGWAEGYRRDGWPSGTPGYLLHGYFRMLHAAGDSTRMVACALDAARHDRMLDVSGGDTTALSEITTTMDALLDRDPSDVRTMTLLAVRRDSLIERNSYVPVGLPAVWALVGHPARAYAMARSIHDPTAKVKAMAALSEALAECEQDVDHQNLDRESVRASDIVREAEVVARSIDDLPDEKEKALTSLARAMARTGDLEKGIALARTIYDPGGLESPLVFVMEAAAKSGDIRGAEAAARTITDYFSKYYALERIARTAALAGDLESGIAVARSIYGLDLQDEALEVIAEALAQNGDAGGAAAAARTIADLRRQVWALARITETIGRTGDRDIASKFASDVVALLRPMSDSMKQAGAPVFAWAGDFTLAVDLARANVSPDYRATTLSEVAEAMARYGELNHAIALTREAEAAARAVDDIDRQARMLAGAMRTAALVGDTDYAGGLANRAWALVQSITDQSWLHGEILAEVVMAQGLGPTRALALAQTITNAHYRDQVLVESVVILARAKVFDGAKALVWTVTNQGLHLEAQPTTLLAGAMARAGELDRARDLARYTETMVRTRNLSQDRARALARAAIAVARSGELGHARTIARNAEILARRVTNPLGRAGASTAVARGFLWADNPEHAMDLVYEAETVTKTSNSSRDSDSVLASIAAAAARAGNIEHALNGLQTITDPRTRAHALRAVIGAVAQLGNLSRARKLVWAITDPSERCRTAAEAAQAAAQAGHYETARILARDAETMAQECSKNEQAWILTVVAAAAAQAQDLDYAQRLAHDAAAAARTITNRATRAELLAKVAQAAARAEDRNHAMNLVSEAESNLRTVAHSPDLSMEQAEVVKAMVLIGDTSRARALTRSLTPHWQAEALVYIAQHASSEHARPLIIQALRLANWEESVDALAVVQPGVLAEVAATLLMLTLPPTT